MTPTAVFSALKGYDAQLGLREASRIESPQIEQVPFHLIDKSFLAQQNLTDLIQGQRAIQRLMSISTKEQLQILEPVNQLFDSILGSQAFLQDQSVDSLIEAKSFLVEQKVELFERVYYLDSESAKSAIESIDGLIETINDVAAAKLAAPKAPLPQPLHASAAARVHLVDHEQVKNQSRATVTLTTQARMEYAPHFAALMGLEIKKGQEKSLERKARFGNDSLFRMAIMGASQEVLGIPQSISGRKKWAFQYAHEKGQPLDPQLSRLIELAARAFNSKEFKGLIDSLTTKNQ